MDKVNPVSSFEQLVYPMLYTKFQGHRPLGSEAGDFLRFFSMYGPGQHLGHVTRNIWTHPMEAPYEIWLQTA